MIKPNVFDKLLKPGFLHDSNFFRLSSSKENAADLLFSVSQSPSGTARWTDTSEVSNCSTNANRIKRRNAALRHIFVLLLLANVLFGWHVLPWNWKRWLLRCSPFCEKFQTLLPPPPPRGVRPSGVSQSIRPSVSTWAAKLPIAINRHLPLRPSPSFYPKALLPMTVVEGFCHWVIRQLSLPC